jgi:hypothetical protein
MIQMPERSAVRFLIILTDVLLLLYLHPARLDDACFENTGLSMFRLIG